MGHSPIVVGGPTMVKVHVHMDDPARVLAYGRAQGEIDDVVVEDMQAQAEAYKALRVGHVRPALGLVAVVPGAGFARLFEDMGAVIVQSGQTMNPSAGEMAEAARRAGSEAVIILPNNPNVRLAAEQAGDLVGPDGAHPQMYVLPTRHVAEGIAAALSFPKQNTPDNAMHDVEQVMAAMERAARGLRAADITTATRDVTLNGVQVRAGEYIGLIDGEIRAKGTTLAGVAQAVLARAYREDQNELVTLYYGADSSAAEAQALADALRNHYPRVEFVVLYGGQAHYPVMMAIE
jgi:hypothetical protein